jgi:protein-arginine kinase activator protein McsA
MIGFNPTYLLGFPCHIVYAAYAFRCLYALPSCPQKRNTHYDFAARGILSYSIRSTKWLQFLFQKWSIYSNSNYLAFLENCSRTFQLIYIVPLLACYLPN